MHAPGAITVVHQRGSVDCGIAALAMCLRMPYRDVRHAADRDVPAWRVTGLGVADLQTMAAALGTPLVRAVRQKHYLAGMEGVLGVLGRKMRGAGHWVYYRTGVIVDPAGPQLWLDALDYMLEHQARPATLLVKPS